MKKSHFYPSLAVVLLLIAAFCWLPLPYSIYAPAVLELRSGSTSANVLAPKSGGILQEICVKDGQYVDKGQPIAVLKNPVMDSELNSLLGQLRETMSEMKMCEQLGNTQEAVARLAEATERYKGLRNAITAMQEERKRLTLTAPISGYVVSPYWRLDRESKYQDAASALPMWEGTPLLDRNLNTTLEPGAQICSIGNPKKLEALVVVDQSKINFIQEGQTVKVKLIERPGETYLATVANTLDIEHTTMTSIPFQLSVKGGGPVSTETVEGGLERPQSGSYRVRVAIDNDDEIMTVGMTAKCKIKATPQTLLQRLVRLCREVFNFKL